MKDHEEINKSKLKQKLQEIAGNFVTYPSDKVKTIVPAPLVSKEPSKNKEKQIPCYIYLGRLKQNPKILITQLRYEPFANVEDCEEWCKLHCINYEIKDNKSSKTIIKV